MLVLVPVLRKAQPREGRGGRELLSLYLGGPGALKMQWKVWSPPCLEVSANWGNTLWVSQMWIRGWGDGCQNFPEKLRQGTHLHLVVSADPTSPGHPPIRAEHSTIRMQVPPRGATLFQSWASFLHPRGPRMETNACLDVGMLRSSCGQCEASWPPSGTWATSESHCPRHYWATLEWRKFHISTAARFFHI